MLELDECDDWETIKKIMNVEKEKAKEELLEDIHLVLECLEGEELKSVFDLLLRG